MQSCLLLFIGETAAQHSRQALAGYVYPAKRSVLAHMRSTHHGLQHTHTSVKYSAHTLQLGAYTHSWTHAYKHAHKPLENLALTRSDTLADTYHAYTHTDMCCIHLHTHTHTHIYTCGRIHPTTHLNTDTSLHSDTCVRTVAHIYQAYLQVLPNDTPHSEHTGSLTHSGIHMHIQIYKPTPPLPLPSLTLTRS